ncbi:MAG: primosomal replication protein N [Formivibrio sp.]|nr:primosomal replication protein N [Formivibrio sp.]
MEGVLFERQPLRHTPAGLPVIEALIVHRSEQIEAGQSRKVECEVQIIVLGKSAEAFSLIEAGEKVAIHGFLAAKSMRRRQDIVLHIEEFELLN